MTAAGAARGDVAAVVAAVDDLFAAIHAKDIPGIQARYLHEPRLLVFLEGPDSKVDGWDQESNEAAWRMLLDQVTFTELRVHDDLRAGRDGDLGWVAGTLTLSYEPVGGGPTHDATNRGTWILERQDRGWVVVCEHVSFPVPDPYPLPQSTPGGTP